MTRYRSFLKDAKPALAPVFSRAQAFFLRIVPDDMDGLAVCKTEAGARPGRTTRAKDAKQHKRTVGIGVHIHLVTAKLSVPEHSEFGLKTVPGPPDPESDPQ